MIKHKFSPFYQIIRHFHFLNFFCQSAAPPFGLFFVFFFGGSSVAMAAHNCEEVCLFFSFSVLMGFSNFELG